MYRDDRCAVCGEALPPDHFYCATHGADVDERLRALGGALGRLVGELGEAAALAPGIAQATWDWLAGDEDWPPVADVELLADADDVTVDVADPGTVKVRVRVPLPDLLTALHAALSRDDIHGLGSVLVSAEGADATH